MRDEGSYVDFVTVRWAAMYRLARDETWLRCRVSTTSCERVADLPATRRGTSLPKR